MLRGHKSPGTIVAEIKMRRMFHGGAFLLVEGADDVRFWASRRHAGCELLDGEGKPNVLGAIQRVDAAGVAGALGLVDDDGDMLTGARVESGNLLYTDAHDLECLLCRSSALDKVLAEYGDPAKIRRFETAHGDVRNALLERALVFGRLRLAARLARPAARLDVKIPRFLKPDTWAVEANDKALVRASVPDSPDDARAITSRLVQLPLADPWYVVRGHDLIEILVIGLRRVLGDLPAQTGAKQIASVLRVGMTPEDLRRTRLWADVHEWQAANHPYTVLAD